MRPVVKIDEDFREVVADDAGPPEPGVLCGCSGHMNVKPGPAYVKVGFISSVPLVTPQLLSFTKTHFTYTVFSFITQSAFVC